MTTRQRVRLVTGLSAVLVGLAVASTGAAPVAGRTSASLSALDQAIAAACNQDHVIILIHGTASSGSFRAEAGTPPTNTQLQGPWITAAMANQSKVNHEFDELLASTSNCRVLTFSYDDMYLTPTNGAATPGVYAWNDQASPWSADTVVLADRLQDLIDHVRSANSSVTIDLLGYSAGGIVPMYWAATATPTDRGKVRSIIVVDGIVSGVEVWVVELICALPSSIRNIPNTSFGHFPCHFRRSSTYPERIRNAGWPSDIKIATLRAKGDRLVWWEWAGLPGTPQDQRQDPDLIAHGCSSLSAWVSSFISCVLKHESVLKDPTARTSVDWVVGP